MRRLALALVFMTALAAPPLAAQLTQAPDTTRESLCFRGRPRPACDLFWLTEFGIAGRVDWNRRDEHGAMFTWELGMARNLKNNRQAVGLALFAQGGDGVGGFGIRPRLRFWVSPKASFDVAAGAVAWGTGGGPGFSGHASLNFGDYGAVGAHVVAMTPEDFDQDRSARFGVFMGGRLGSVPGAVTGLAFPTLVLVILLVACGSGGCFYD